MGLLCIANCDAIPVISIPGGNYTPLALFKCAAHVLLVDARELAKYAFELLKYANYLNSVIMEIKLISFYGIKFEIRVDCY